MPAKPKTWKQKMQAKPPHIVRLDKDFAGVPAGARAVTATDAQGARTFPLPAISLTADARDRVTVIDARRPATATALPGVVKVGLAGTLAYGLYRLLRRTP